MAKVLNDPGAAIQAGRVEQRMTSIKPGSIAFWAWCHCSLGGHVKAKRIAIAAHLVAVEFFASLVAGLQAFGPGFVVDCVGVCGSQHVLLELLRGGA